MEKTLKDHLDAATLEQAIKWNGEQDKFVFCIDLMEISANDEFSDDWVNALEDKFEELLAAAK
jgi:hypothetical protein